MPVSGPRATRRAAHSLRLAGVLVVFAALVLCCGGGGDGSEPAQKPPEPSPGAEQAPHEKGPDEPSPEEWPHPRVEARQAERDSMVAIIRAYGLKDKAVLKAMAAVPRHEFVGKKLQRAAYKDSPLPIGHGQTISQPYIVAKMTLHLELEASSKVLEVGTGSGYQAAVLSEFTPRVYTIEIVKPLADSAAKRFERLGYTSVKARHGDGYHGWKEHAPYDAIIVTAAAGHVPPPLLAQLAPGGKMVIPVGGPFSVQELLLLEKDISGTVTTKALGAVRFVPFVRSETEGN